MENRARWLIVALALMGVAGGVYAQSTSSSNATTPNSATTGGRHGYHHRGGMMGGFMLHALHQLNLTDTQKQSVHGILANARAQFKAARQSAVAPNFAALANPGDPNHAAALQDMQSRMSARLQAREQLQQQIYGVLTDEQKTQLASIIAARQAKLAQHGAS
jgi:Spy/CpxP family protein refolding chaperone